jgi:hypothetical protein
MCEVTFCELQCSNRLCIPAASWTAETCKASHCEVKVVDYQKGEDDTYEFKPTWALLIACLRILRYR